LRDFARALDGSPVEVLDRSRFESPNESETYQTKLSYGGIHRVLAWANVREVHNTQQYFDKSLRGQEQLSIDQRGGLLHAEFAPMVGAQIAVEGSMNRSLSEYALRANRSSLVTSQTMQTSFNFSPSSGSRASAVLNLDRKKNERQATGNGLNISRFLQVNGAYRLSPRLALDAAGTVSLFSSQYVDSTLRVATIQMTHNFLFRDSGSFTRPIGGGTREYNVGSETYQQTLGATLGIMPMAGVQLFVTQSLGNTKSHFPATNTGTVDNRWNLAVGATVERTMMGGAALRGSAQHC